MSKDLTPLHAQKIFPVIIIKVLSLVNIGYYLMSRGFQCVKPLGSNVDSNPQSMLAL